MAKKDEAPKEEARPIIIKKINRGGHGHHGGAWKVAYADFVTAMMAFFLLLWLLNSTSQEQKEGIADYFDPTPMKVSREVSGAGGVMGGTTVTVDGAMTSNKAPPVTSQTAPSYTLNPDSTKQADPDKIKDEELQKEQRRREEAKFKEVKSKIEAAIQASDVKDLAKNLIMDMTPEGLRIQIVDQEGESMFPSGSAIPFEKTKKLLAVVSMIIKPMPNQISIKGHTDAVQYAPGADYTNWELSSDRANASRRVLVESGIEEKKLSNVQGKADTEHLKLDDPMAPVNRRISIILLNDTLAGKGGSQQGGISGGQVQPTQPAEPAYKPSPGKVQFP